MNPVENQKAAMQRKDFHVPDPILKDLWRVKAQINKDCEYSVDKVFEMARASRLTRTRNAGGKHRQG